MSLELGPDNSYYIQAGKYRIRLETEDIDDATKQKAVRELRETPENVEYGMRELKKILTDDPDLHVPIDNDDFLIKFLRPCKYYPKSAYELIKRFYNFKKKHPSYCDDLYPSKTVAAFHQGLIGFQEVRDSNGCRIIVLETGGKWKPNECTTNDLFRAVQIALEAATSEPNTQVNGVVAIFNLLGFSLTHALHITPSFAKMVVDWIQDSIPIRLKAIHIVNQPYIFNMVYALFKPFLRDKLKKRLHFHGSNFDSLKKHLPESALRLDFKGTMDLAPLPGDVLYELMTKYEEEFVYANSFGYKLKSAA